MPDKLTALALKALSPGWHNDGRGLYAVVRSAGSRSWVFRYRRDGKLHDVGLGSLADVTLKQARTECDRLRALRQEGADPLVHKRQRKLAQKLADAKAITFMAAAESYIETNGASLSSPIGRVLRWSAAIREDAACRFYAHSSEAFRFAGLRQSRSERQRIPG